MRKCFEITDENEKASKPSNWKTALGYIQLLDSFYLGSDIHLSHFLQTHPLLQWKNTKQDPGSHCSFSSQKFTFLSVLSAPQFQRTQGNNTPEQRLRFYSLEQDICRVIQWHQENTFFLESEVNEVWMRSDSQITVQHCGKPRCPSCLWCLLQAPPQHKLLWVPTRKS